MARKSCKAPRRKAKDVAASYYTRKAFTCYDVEREGKIYGIGGMLVSSLVWAAVWGGLYHLDILTLSWPF